MQGPPKQAHCTPHFDRDDENKSELEKMVFFVPRQLCDCHVISQADLLGTRREGSLLRRSSYSPNHP